MMFYWLDAMHLLMRNMKDFHYELTRKQCAAIRIQRTWRRISSDPNIPMGRKVVMSRFHEMGHASMCP